VRPQYPRQRLARRRHQEGYICGGVIFVTESDRRSDLVDRRLQSIPRPRTQPQACCERTTAVQRNRRAAVSVLGSSRRVVSRAFLRRPCAARVADPRPRSGRVGIGLKGVEPKRREPPLSVRSPPGTYSFAFSKASISCLVRKTAFATVLALKYAALTCNTPPRSSTWKPLVDVPLFGQL
jgi:hypothetical protein